MKNAIIVLGIIAIIGIAVYTATSTDVHVPDPSVGNCILDKTPRGTHGTFATSTEDCLKKREQYQADKVAWLKETDLRQKAANKLCGTDIVFSSDMWDSHYQRLHCETTERNYEWSDGAWVEAEISKKCTQFKDSVIGVIPVSCFDYLGITNE